MIFDTWYILTTLHKKSILTLKTFEVLFMKSQNNQIFTLGTIELRFVKSENITLDALYN